jgi:hypothetical protein
VLLIDKRYYAVDNGVWFTAANPNGPWAVADSVPSDEIGKIPPSSPVYNTTHVHIYESTPEVVYVGYTPGYLWSFPYYGVPVYGTGWYYPPYSGRWYYPRPPTWGMHVGYNPWTGWNFGVSWSNGFFSLGATWGGGWGGAYRPWGCCSGWYGGGYRRPVVINTGNINIGNNINVGNRTNIGNRIGNNNLNLDRSRNNVYNRPQTRQRNASPALARNNIKQARPTTERANDVFADRNGNVARRVNDQWETRDQGKWQRDNQLRDTPINRPSTPTRDIARDNPRTATPTRNYDRSSLQRSHQARQRGFSRESARMGGGMRMRR